MKIAQLSAWLYPKRHAVGIVLLLTYQLLFVWNYIGAERTIHFWDYAMYHDWARELAQLAAQNGAAAWQQFQSRLADDYNLIYALPSLLTFPIFGDSRQIFILTNFLFFMLLWQAMMAGIVRRLFVVRWRVAAFWTLLAASLIPPLWVPLLTGFPDAAAASCILAAVWLILGKRRDWRYALLLGTALAAAILLRRHYAYPAMAVLMTGAIMDSARLLLPGLLSQYRVTRQFGLPFDRLGGLSRYALFYAGSGFIVLTLMYLVAPVFFTNILTTNYMELYQSYNGSVGFYLDVTTKNFGLLLLFAAAVGYGLIWHMVPAMRRGLARLLLANILAWGLWSFGPAHGGAHYMIHLLPAFCVVGLIGLYHALRRYKKISSYVMLGVMAVALTSNVAWAFWLAPESSRLNTGRKFSRIVSAPYPPEQRTDLQSLTALATTLVATTTASDRIVIIGSSQLFNQDIVARALANRLSRPDVAQRILWIPEVDHKQQPPYDVYAEGTVFVVPNKPQYHLDPAGQKVLTALIDQFPPSKKMAGIFKADAQTYEMMDNIELTVWRRKSWSYPQLIEAQLAMQKFIGIPREWVTIQGANFATTETQLDKGSTLVVRISPSTTASFLLLRPIAGGAHRLSMEVVADSGCARPVISLAVTNGQGRKLYEKNLRPVVVPGLLYHPFNIQRMVETAYLTLTITAEPMNGFVCGYMLKGLAVESLAKQ